MRGGTLQSHMDVLVGVTDVNLPDSASGRLSQVTYAPLGGQLSFLPATWFRKGLTGGHMSTLRAGRTYAVGAESPTRERR